MQLRQVLNGEDSTDRETHLLDETLESPNQSGIEHVSGQMGNVPTTTTIASNKTGDQNTVANTPTFDPLAFDYGDGSDDDIGSHDDRNAETGLRSPTYRSKEDLIPPPVPLSALNTKRCSVGAIQDATPGSLVDGTSRGTPTTTSGSDAQSLMASLNALKDFVASGQSHTSTISASQKPAETTGHLPKRPRMV